MSRKDAPSPNITNENRSNSAAAGGGGSSGITPRRPVIIRDAQQRAMLHKIRDSLAHLQKHPDGSTAPASPGGASGTSTPSTKESNVNSAAASKDGLKRGDNYNNAAMEEIRKSLQTFKKDGETNNKESDLEATAKVNVRELIQQICPSEPRNGLSSKFGGLVPSASKPTSTTAGITKLRADTIASPTMYSDGYESAPSPGVAYPPPLPPRTRGSSTPPPPLPPRDSVPGSSALSRTSAQYQPIKRRETTNNSTNSTPRHTATPSPVATRSSAAMTAPSATPPSSLEQLAEQMGMSTQEIQEILIQHSVNRNRQQQLIGPADGISPVDTQYVIDRQSAQSMLANSMTTAAASVQGNGGLGYQGLPPHYEHYTTNAKPIDSRHHHTQPHPHQMAPQQQSLLQPSSATLASPSETVTAATQANPPPPPQYSSTHIISTAPPPPYNPAAHYQTSATVAMHQPSPASSVTSGSSNDYLLVNYGAGNPYITGDYRTPAYGESPSSGSSSPASLHSNANYTYLHPSSAAAGFSVHHHHPHQYYQQHHHHHNNKPIPIDVREAKQGPVITHSAHSHMVNRPYLQTVTSVVGVASNPAPPPNYASSVHAHVTPHTTSHVNGNKSVAVASPVRAGQHGSPLTPGGGSGGNVHIKLRYHQDPQFQVTGNPKFQVTAQNSYGNVLKPNGRPNDHGSPSIQIQFSTGGGTAINPISVPLDSSKNRKGSLETRSDSPVSRTTNQSPCSMISTASTNSDLPERPPPPYPGNNKPPYLGNGGLPPSTGPTLSDHSELEQSETESEASEKRGTTHRCTSPIPRLRPEAESQDSDRHWTNLRHYSPAAFKFYMEQHVENVLKQHQERIRRRVQLEKEMSKVDLSEEAKTQMRLMLKQKETNYLRLKRAKMDRSMFEVIAKLGVGAFGEVSLVRKCHVLTDDYQGQLLYAMKTLRKVDVIRRNQVAHVKAERDILAEAELEWVTKLYYSFQDKENLYFIMEYIPGGDLMALLIKKGLFEENLAIFYVAEMVLAIESVHKMGFIHRDIKPDNILIDKDGHIKLTDFGLCTGFRWTHNSKYYQEGHNRQDSMDPQDMTSDPCQCQQKELNKILERRRKKEKQRCLAHSLVGTPNYIAPEVLMRQGYTRSCDWWSVGVILYEMLVGHPPFMANTPKETQIRVVHWKSELHIPHECELSEAAHNLILKLCCGAENRLGKNGAEEIKKHRFFKSIDFNDLRRQKAPYKPIIKHPTDTSNFDDVDDQPPCQFKTDDLRRNGNYPEHAFSEFTFRRFFDDGGHVRPFNITESLSHGLMTSLNVNNGTHSTSNTTSQSDDRTPQNSYHEEDSGAGRGNSNKAGNPVYV